MTDAYEVIKNLHMNVLQEVFIRLPVIFARCFLQCDTLSNVLSPMALTEFCPVIVGGFAYYFYMRKNGLEGMFSDDIDIKIAIQKTAEELNTKNRLVRTMIKAFRYSVVKNVLSLVDAIFNAIRSELGVSLQTSVRIGGSYRSLEDVEKAILTDIVPLDLCHITVTYGLGDTRVHMGLLDTSFFMQSLDPSLDVMKQYNMYRDIIPNVDTSVASTIVGMEPVCVGEPPLCMFIANPLYMLLDTVRMLSKVEPIGDNVARQPSHGDYYKYPKYVIKFMELLSLPEFKQVLHVDITPFDIEIAEVMRNLLMQSTSLMDLGKLYKYLHHHVLQNAGSSAYTVAYNALYTPRLRMINQTGGGGTSTRGRSDEEDLMYLSKQPHGIAGVIRESDKKDVLRAIDAFMEKVSTYRNQGTKRKVKVEIQVPPQGFSTKKTNLEMIMPTRLPLKLAWDSS